MSRSLELSLVDRVTQAGSPRVFPTMDTVPLIQDPTTDALPGLSSKHESREHWRRLFAAVGLGSERALAELYDLAVGQLYGLAVWSTGSADDAADVVATVWVKIAEQRHRLTAVRDPQAWLLAVTRRVAIDVLRLRRRRRPAESLETAALVLATEPEPDRQIDAQRASALLATLPSKHREVVYLKHFVDCTFAEIGAILGVTRFTAASRYRLAIRRLRRLMEVST
jgi:RNA polymerase sigma-70 factor (ECF subfamily)